jgi:hypothetical protein
MPAAEPAAGAQCKSISPSFAVAEVVAAAEYYRDKLGFQIVGYFLDPPIYAIVRRDSVEIHLGRIESNGPSSPNAVRRRIAGPPEKRVYRCYEMVVEDSSGFRIAFGMNFDES